MTDTEAGTPRGLWADWTTLGITIACDISLFVGCIILYFNRKVPYIRGRQPAIVITQSIPAIIWTITQPVTNNQFERPPNTFWAECDLFSFWFTLCFGFGWWVNCLVVRMWRLWRRIFGTSEKAAVEKFNKNRVNAMSNPKKRTKPSLKPWTLYGWREFYLPLLVLELPFFLFAAIADGLNVSVYVPEEDKCVFASSFWSVGLWAVVAIPLGCFIILAWKLRNVREEFNEYREGRNGFLVCMVMVLFLMLAWIMKKAGVDDIWFRVLSRNVFTLTAVFGVMYFFWAFNGKRIWKLIIRDEAYLKQYLEGLKSHTGKFARDYQPVDQFNNPLGSKANTATGSVSSAAGGSGGKSGANGSVSINVSPSASGATGVGATTAGSTAGNNADSLSPAPASDSADDQARGRGVSFAPTINGAVPISDTPPSSGTPSPASTPRIAHGANETEMNVRLDHSDSNSPLHPGNSSTV